MSLSQHPHMFHDSEVVLNFKGFSSVPEKDTKIKYIFIINHTITQRKEVAERPDSRAEISTAAYVAKSESGVQVVNSEYFLKIKEEPHISS